jgi:hypothetical protein
MLEKLTDTSLFLTNLVNHRSQLPLAGCRHKHTAAIEQKSNTLRLHEKYFLKWPICSKDLGVNFEK